MTSPTAIAAYLALFTVVGFVFLCSNLLLGWLLRPRSPNAEKLEVYECGEPTIGSSFVQFDLRFYVVALLFIIFDVEVAFFFPWAAVFGKATQLMDPNFPIVATASADGAASPAAKSGAVQLTPAATSLYRELGVNHPTAPAGVDVQQAEATLRADAGRLALLSIFDIGAFFGVLLVGFAYVWRRGDLDWVRAVSRDRAADVPQPCRSAGALEQQRPAVAV